MRYKPEPHAKCHQAASAHDTFGILYKRRQINAHMIMWLMSRSCHSRSFRMMEGFGECILRFVNENNESMFCKVSLETNCFPCCVGRSIKNIGNIQIFTD